MTAFTLLGFSRRALTSRSADFVRLSSMIFLSFGGPAVVGNAGAGEVDDIIGLADGFGVDIAGGRVPVEALEARRRMDGRRRRRRSRAHQGTNSIRR